MIALGAAIPFVVTNPDRAAGRGLKLRPPPVKERALTAGLEVLQPDRARDPLLAERLERAAPDVCVVVAYGKILPAGLLAIPRRGFVNVHFSLLPLYRGAAPVQRAIMDGRDATGVSIMVLSEGMDEGPVLASLAEAIAPEDTAGALGERLSFLGGRLLADTLPGYLDGKIAPVPQDDSAATYAPKITPDEARIDWAHPAGRIRDLVRALNPAPGAWTTLRGARLKVYRVSITEEDEPAAGPGELRSAESLSVGTGDQPVRLEDVQLAGKRRMMGAELARGLRLRAEERLE